MYSSMYVCKCMFMFMFMYVFSKYNGGFEILCVFTAKLSFNNTNIFWKCNFNVTVGVRLPTCPFPPLRPSLPFPLSGPSQLVHGLFLQGSRRGYSSKFEPNLKNTMYMTN